MEENSRIVVVTGGNGFLGRRIVCSLLEKAWLQQVRVLDLQPENNFADAVNDSEGKVVYTRGSITDSATVSGVIRGCHVVIHTAAIVAEGFMRPSRVEAINVGGTETVLKACLQQEEKENPRLLILAGSVTSYITHTSNKNQHVVNERTPLPSPNSLIGGEYARTKNLAERLVLEKDGTVRQGQSNMLRTCVLRCTPMYGEDDPSVMTPMVDAGMKAFGFVPHMSCNIQVTYVGNAADAFVTAIESFLRDESTVGGRAYLLSDDTPVRPLSAMSASILEKCGRKARLFPMPSWLLLGVALMIQAVVSIISSCIVPIALVGFQLTPARMRLASASYVFDGSNTHEALGLKLRYSAKQALDRTALFYRKRHRLKVE